MKKSLLQSVRAGASSLVLSAALMSATAGVLSVAMVSPAFAAISLTTSETSSLQTSLTASIKAANGDPAAIEAAIAQAVENAITTYGPDAAGSITSAVLTIAESAGATGAEIGTGLAQASASEAPNNLAAASAIASTLSNEGKSTEVAAYETTADGLGYSNLASIAGASPSTLGETGGNVGGSSGNGFTNSGSGGSGGGCLNPSCTSL